VERCGVVDGFAVLDLGCGNGYFSRQMALRGARVTGIDLSPQQIAAALAREAEHPLGIRYLVMDAERLTEQLVPESIDLVTACVSLGDMPHPERAITGAGQVLRPGGRLVFCITHPCTDTPLREWERDAYGQRRTLKIGRYFEGAPVAYHWGGPRFPYDFSISSVHHPLADWLNWVMGAGLVLRRIAEPSPSEATLAAHPDLGAALIPEFLLVDATKPG
jgi:SAM-dependent methyltransferase